MMTNRRCKTVALWICMVIFGAHGAFGQEGNALLEAGMGALQDCCDRLVDATRHDTADDTEARMAIHGAALKAREADKAVFVEQALLERLAETDSQELRLFLLE